MNLQKSFAERETGLSSKLREKQAAIDDPTGKGTATEYVVEEQLLRPFLPPGFDCGKGAVIRLTTQRYNLRQSTELFLIEEHPRLLSMTHPILFFRSRRWPEWLK